MYLKIKTYLKMKYEKYFKESKDGIYLFAYAFMLLSEIWDVSAASHNPFRYTFTSTVLLLVYEYLTGSRKSFIITAFFTAGVFSLIWLKVPIISKNMFLCMLFIYTARKINFERIGKFTLFFTGAVVLFIVFCAYMGFLPNYSFTGRVRTAMGFGYPLFLPAYLMNITMLAVYLYRKDMKHSGRLLLFVLNMLVYIKCDGRISFACASCFLVCEPILKFLEKNVSRLHKWFSLSILSFPIGLVVSFAVTLSYGGKSQWVILLNSLLLERLRLGYEGLQIYGIQPFYQKIEWIGSGFALKGEPLPGKYNWIDNLYIRNYVDNGFIVATLFFAFLTFAAYAGWKRRDYLFLTIMALCAVHGMIDDSMMRLDRNTFLLLCGSMIYQELHQTNNDVYLKGQEV